MSSVPRELRTDLVEDGGGQSMRVETRVIMPLSGWGGASQNRIEFQLPMQGILDRSSYLKFKIKTPNDNQRLPLWAGALSMIETATLRIGGVEIQTRRGFGQLSTAKQFFRTPADRNARQSKRIGCFSGLMVDGTQTGAVGGVLANKPGHWGVDTGQGWATATSADDRHITDGYRVTDVATTTPEWIIDLAQLFPILFSNSLPLGLLDQHINIVLELSEDLVRGQRSVATGANVWAAGTDLIEPSLHVDLIFFDDQIGEVTTMEKLADELEKGERLVFTDDVHVRYNQVAGAAAAITEVKSKISIGVDNQVVRSVFASATDIIDYGTATTSGSILLGQYYSAGSPLENSIQLTVNNNPVYPSPVTRDSELWNELSQVMPTKFKVNSAVYSHFGQVDAAGAVAPLLQRLTNKTLWGAGHEQSREQGLGHYYGVNLSKPGYQNVAGAGTAIGRNPVLLEIGDTRVPTDYGAKLIHVWVTCERLMSIVGGKIMVSGS
jgi:hypothetical protein